MSDIAKRSLPCLSCGALYDLTPLFTTSPIDLTSSLSLALFPLLHVRFYDHSPIDDDRAGLS